MSDNEHFSLDREKRNNNIRLSAEKRSKFQTYLLINPNLVINDIYIDKANSIPEYQRINFSRLRLSSHNLKIETGRWSRIPREERLCNCGILQTEYHIIFDCSNTKTIRDTFTSINFNLSFSEFFSENNIEVLCSYLYQIIDVFSL